MSKNPFQREDFDRDEDWLPLKAAAAANYSSPNTGSTGTGTGTPSSSSAVGNKLPFPSDVFAGNATKDLLLKTSKEESISYSHQPAGDYQSQERASASTTTPPRSSTNSISASDEMKAANPFDDTVISPPPAAAPPPPPPSESDAGSVRSVTLDDDGHEDFDNSPGQASDSTGFPSIATPPNYHYGLPPPDSAMSRFEGTSSNYYSSYQNARAAPVPMITNYGVSPNQALYPSQSGDKRDPTARDLNATSYQYTTAAPSSMLRGDASVRPNTGQTNDEYGGIGSLREVTSRLRWCTIATTLSALIWEGFAFPERLLVNSWEHPAKVVLGGYLAFFCLLLLGVELNAPMRENFGVLYHPLGRGFLLFLLATMSYGIHIAWWELLLCAAFSFCSLGYIFSYVKYPEYRRWQDYNDNRIWQDVRTAIRGPTGDHNWADPNATNNNVVDPQWQQAQQETQSLLHQV